MTTCYKIVDSLLVMKYSPSIQVFGSKPLIPMSTDRICGEPTSLFSICRGVDFVIFHLERDTGLFFFSLLPGT